MTATLNQTVARLAVGTVGTAVCAAICLFGATAPAHAGTFTYDQAVPTATVVYSDLDLGRSSGRATLARRLGNAARAVCGVGATTSRDFDIRDTCVRDEVSRGMQTAITRAQVAAR